MLALTLQCQPKQNYCVIYDLIFCFISLIIHYCKPILNSILLISSLRDGGAFERQLRPEPQTIIATVGWALHCDFFVNLRSPGFSIFLDPGQVGRRIK